MTDIGPPLDARLKASEYEDGKISRLVFVDEHGEKFRLEGEMEIVDPFDDEPIPDGGVVAERDKPPLPQVIADVLDDANGGLDRQILIERVAKVSGATLDEVEEVLGGEIRYGRVDVADGQLRKATNRRFLGRGRR